MPNNQNSKPKRRSSKWLLLLIIAANILASWAIKPIMPYVQVPAENLAGPLRLPVMGDIYLTNTIVAILIADVLLFAFAFIVHRQLRSGDLVPHGLSGAIEAILEALYNLVSETAHKWAEWIFPWVASLVLVVLVVNWMELIPGVDSIGFLHEAHEGVPVYETQSLLQMGSFNLSTITAEIEPLGEEAHGIGFTPFVRVASTDLNFTIALAVTSVVMTQVLGVKAAGVSYFKKFFNFDGVMAVFSKTKEKKQFGPIFAFTDIFVGLLELISEFARIISFAFRLFGNIFAGSVLLFVMGSLVPVLVQSIFLFLELFVGLIQAIVFGMLTLVFMSMATISHEA